MRIGVIGLILLALSACDKPSSDNATASASSSSAASKTGTSGTEAKPIGAQSVELKFTGRYDGDKPDSAALFNVTNKSDKKLFYVEAWHYYYDKDKKQLGRKYTGKTVGSMEPGSSKQLVFGWTKAELPASTAFVEAVLVGANFDGGAAFKGDVTTLAPEQREMGATPVPVGG